MFLDTEKARYMVYLDGTNYWLRIRQLESGIHVNIEVYYFIGLLFRGGMIALNKKRTNTKTLIFDRSSGDLHSADNYIDTYTTINGNKQKLFNLMARAQKNISTMTREEVRAEKRIRRQYPCPYGYKLAFPD